MTIALTLASRLDGLFFQPIKQSGLGREGSRYGLDDFTELK